MMAAKIFRGHRKKSDDPTLQNRIQRQISKDSPRTDCSAWRFGEAPVQEGIDVSQLIPLKSVKHRG
jgi:hypothetical protein